MNGKPDSTPVATLKAEAPHVSKYMGTCWSLDRQALPLRKRLQYYEDSSKGTQVPPQTTTNPTNPPHSPNPSTPSHLESLEQGKDSPPPKTERQLEDRATEEKNSKRKSSLVLKISDQETTRLALFISPRKSETALKTSISPPSSPSEKLDKKSQHKKKRTSNGELGQKSKKLKLKKPPKEKSKEDDNAESSSGQDTLEEEELYCVCRRPYFPDREFMIACDSCDGWFHGHCVGVTQEDSLNIKMYLCPPCKGKRKDRSPKIKPMKNAGVQDLEEAPKKKENCTNEKKCTSRGCTLMARPNSRFCVECAVVREERESNKEQLKVSKPHKGTREPPLTKNYLLEALKSPQLAPQPPPTINTGETEEMKKPLQPEEKRKKKSLVEVIPSLPSPILEQDLGGILDRKPFHKKDLDTPNWNRKLSLAIKSEETTTTS